MAPHWQRGSLLREHDPLWYANDIGQGASVRTAKEGFKW